MAIGQPRTALQIHSTIKSGGELELSLAEVAIPTLSPADVLVRVEATPLNPSDQGVMFGGADLSKARFSGTKSRPVVTAPLSQGALAGMAARLDKPMPVGNEGAGVVIEAGSSAQAQALLGRTVALWGGGMYTTLRAAPATDCLLLPESATPAQGASSFVNPLTALGMVETMRSEGHKALVHTAAASNLGLMLNRICMKDGIDLVNIVRRQEQAEQLRSIGAKHVCVSTAPGFADDLVQALVETGATIAFDATGGGQLASDILNAMEKAAVRTATTWSRYGSTVHKQVYLYGSLDTSPTVLVRTFGTAWSVGGWLVFGFLQKAGAEIADRLKARVAAELTTTFASHYTKEVSMAEALSAEAIAHYGKRATGEKYLIRPGLDA